MASDAVVNLVVNASDAEPQITAQMRRLADTAERNAPTVNLRVDLNTGRIERELNLLGTRLNSSLGAVNTSIQDGFRDLTGELTASLNVISRQLSDVNSNLRTMDDRLDRLGQSNGLRRVADDADDADDSTRRLSDTFRRIGSSAAGIALAAARVGLVASAASGAVPVLAGVAAAVENIAPASAVAASGILTVVAASATLKLGLTGVSDAINAVFDPDADPEQVAEALDRLSKNARSFVEVLRDARPAFDELRLDVQDRLFQGLDKTLSATAKSTFPVLRTAALDFADTFNKMARNAGTSAQELSADGTLGRALKSGSDAFANLQRIPGQVLEAVVRLADAGGPHLERLTGKISEVADSLSTRLEDAAKSGALQEAVDRAVNTLKQLGRIGGNIFGALGNIIGVADGTGRGLFGTLEQITEALESGTESPVFQRVLRSLIDLSTTLVSTVLPLLGQAFTVLAPVITTIVPPIQELVTLLGERLGELLPALQPVLEQIAVNFSDLLAALTPLIEQGFRVLVAVMPSLNDLMTSLNGLIQAAAPLIEQLAPLLAVVLTGAIVIVVEAMALIVTSITNVVTLISFIIERWKDFASTLAGVVTEALKLVGDLITGDFSGAWEHLQNIVGDVAGFVSRTVSGLKDTVLTLIGNLAALLPGAARRAFQALVTAATQKVSETVTALGKLGGRAVSAVASIGPAMFRAGSAIIGSLVDGIRSRAGAVAGAVGDIISGARDLLPFSPAKKGPFSGRGYPLYSGRALMEALATGIRQRSGMVQTAMLSALGGTSAASVAVTGSLLPAGSPSATTGSLTSVPSGLLTRTAPNVTVQIGNRVINDHIRVIVDDATAQRDRLAAQGARI